GPASAYPQPRRRPQGAQRTVPRAATQQTHPYEAVWKALSYGLPEAPIILAALAYTHTDWLQSLLGRLAPFYPYAVFGAGVLLGWRFHRSRLLFALLLVTLADRTLLHFAVGQGLARHPVVLQAIGVLLPLNLAALLFGAERGVLTPPGLARFALIMGQLALVASLDHMAYQDSLTGLPARRALNEALLRLGGHYTVAMLDVDHFKRINDHHGHDVGDQVLKMIAAKLAQVTGGGKAYRYGGEEFAVIFAGRGAEECLSDLEGLRQTVEDTRFILRARFRSKKKKEKVLTDRGPGERVPVTISIGVAAKNERHTKWDQVVKAADRALYRAKEGGRNQVQT